MYLSKIQIFIKKYYKSLLWAIIILYLSLANINENETIKVLLFPFSDKIAHLTVYAILSFLILYDRSKKKETIVSFYRFGILRYINGITAIFSYNLSQF